jgi:hypothetical protein
MSEQQIVETFEIAEEKYEEKSTNTEYQGVTGIFFQSVNENN